MKLIKIFVLLTMSNAIFAADAVSISREIAGNVENLFYKRNFSAINQLDDDFRTHESRLPDGRWKITMIYDNFGEVSWRGAENEFKLQLQLVDEWISQTPAHPAPYFAKSKILQKI